MPRFSFIHRSLPHSCAIRTKSFPNHAALVVIRSFYDSNFKPRIYLSLILYIKHFLLYYTDKRWSGNILNMSPAGETAVKHKNNSIRT